MFKSVISVNRFENILRFPRFDDRRTRAERHETDKLAAFRDIWTMFTARLPMMYRPDMDMTVDEQLVSFRGRCSFRQYIPSNPGKYGLKIFWNCNLVVSAGRRNLPESPTRNCSRQKPRCATSQTSDSTLAEHWSKHYM